MTTKKSSELPVLVDSKATPVPRQFTWSWLIVVATTFLVYTLGVYTLGVWTGPSAKQLFSGGAPLCAPCAPCSSPKLNDDKSGDDNDKVEFVICVAGLGSCRRVRWGGYISRGSLSGDVRFWKVTPVRCFCVCRYTLERRWPPSTSLAVNLISHP